MTERHKDWCAYLAPIKPNGIAKPCDCGAESEPRDAMSETPALPSWLVEMPPAPMPSLKANETMYDQGDEPPTRLTDADVCRIRAVCARALAGDGDKRSFRAAVEQVLDLTRAVTAFEDDPEYRRMVGLRDPALPSLGGSAPTTVAIPRWMFDHAGERFLVAISPDGTVSIDGGHSDAQGVAKARELYQRLVVIRPPEGTRYVMLAVEEVPPFGGRLNEEAIQVNNHAARATLPSEGARP